MQKNLFLMAAASALMLTACSSENDVLQNAAQSQQTVVDRAVGFDVYTPSATNVTRAGLEGTMTTNRMQRSEADGGGFGVYAFLTEDAIDGDGATAYEPASPLTGSGAKTNVPNFMVNEKLLWNSTNLGWYYNPLKYWPNETNHDSQNTNATMEDPSSKKHLDRLTFFSYAPYVTEAAADGSGTGIIRITDKFGKLNTANTADPTLEWKATTSDADFNPDEGVDLLWGVAPAGGLSYTAVNGTTVTVKEGEPLIDMIKPDVNTSMKFLFQHALARFGINVVAAVDQVSPGGELDANTKITINSFKITGPFGTTGELDLNNGTHAGIANWTKINTTPVVSGTKIISPLSAITLLGESADDNAIAKNLRWTSPHNPPVAQTVVGVTTAKQDLIRPSTNWYNKLAGVPTYDPGKKYYGSDAGAELDAAHKAKYTYTTPTEKNGVWGFLYTEAAGQYTKQGADLTAPDYPTYPGTTPTLYFVKATAYTVTTANTKPTTIPDGVKVYSIDNASNDGTTSAKAPSFTYSSAWTSGNYAETGEGTKVYTLEPVAVATPSEIFTYPAGEYYEAERNYLYVVPTNNFNAVQATPLSSLEEKALRTITVQIEYYITTKDDKLNNGFAQTKNVITKEVVLPSLSNGKTYMLNVVLGLTSVKIEAEVDDWKVINSQADLPQNTAE